MSEKTIKFWIKLGRDINFQEFSKSLENLKKEFNIREINIQLTDEGYIAWWQVEKKKGDKSES